MYTQRNVLGNMGNTKVDKTSLFDAVEIELAFDSERPGCKF